MKDDTEEGCKEIKHAAEHVIDKTGKIIDEGGEFAKINLIKFLQILKLLS